MPRTFEFHISGRRLLIGLLVTAVPISLIAILASTRTGRNSEHAAGQNLRIITESIAAVVKERVRAKVIEAALMASDSAVLAEVTASNRKYERRRTRRSKASSRRSTRFGTRRRDRASFRAFSRTPLRSPCGANSSLSPRLPASP
jgi:hypothetical protein